MLNRGAFGLLLVLGIMVILTSWYSVKFSTILPVSTASIAQTGDLEQGTILQTNAQGLISYQATIAQALQTGAGIIYFTGLVATLYDSARTPWYLSADQGSVLQNNSEVVLNGHVALVRTATPGNPALAFTTSSANIFPKTQVITGDDWLLITQQGTNNMLTGKGFSADLIHKSYQLLSQVKGVYYARP
jgi:lipopolysaccharide export system protein LptC